MIRFLEKTGYDVAYATDQDLDRDPAYFKDRKAIVFVGHSEAVHIEFENPITADEARELLRNAPGVLVIDKREAGGYATPYEAAGEDATYVSRIREDATVENGLALWCVSDNLRKGAALNAIQIAECLINRKLIEAKRKAA